MNLKLVHLTKDHQKKLTEMLDEWTVYNCNNDTYKSPMAIFRNDYHDFDYYLNNLEVKVASEGMVTDSVLFCLDEDRDIFVGAINIRHYLNEGLLKTGGHIGDGIRPSERGKGFGTQLLKLGLNECKKLNIDKVLVICEKDNIASAKCIINNGGILENEVEEDGNTMQRYWIVLKS